jgi:hypothetical protein
MLSMDPKRRPSIQKLLSDPWFTGLDLPVKSRRLSDCASICGSALSLRIPNPGIRIGLPGWKGKMIVKPQVLLPAPLTMGDDGAEEWCRSLRRAKPALSSREISANGVWPTGSY